MNIYIESNFVLELALNQEQSVSCSEIVGICEAKCAGLVLPAYSLVEPWESLIRRHHERKRLSDDLNRELGQLTRNAMYAAKLGEFENVRALLIDSTDEQIKRLKHIQSHLLAVCEIIPLDAGTLALAERHRDANDLSPQDSLVYASVLMHLARSGGAGHCFLNRNSKDFSDPDIIAELDKHACRLMPRFDHGLEYIRSRVS